MKAEWNKLRGEQKEVLATVDELENRERQLAEIADDDSRRESGSVQSFQTRRPSALPDDIYDLSDYRSRATSPEREASLLRDGAMRAVESAQFPHPRAKREDCQGHIERLLERHSEKDGGEIARRILATGSPLYKRAFSKKLVGRPLNDAETRALSLTTTEGGFAVPYVLDPTIIPTSNGAQNPLRAVSRVETITTNEWRGVSSAGITASYDAEATEVGDDAPTVAQPSATPEKAQAFVPYSIEVGGDWGSLGTEMARLIQNAKDELEATKFTVGAGSGSNEPEGIITGATGTVAAGTAAFAVGHLYDLQEALAPRYEPNARFLAHNAIFNLVRQFDTSGGADLWERLGAGLPPELLGYPAHRNSAMDSVLTAGSEIMVFGDFEHFLIVDRVGLNVEVIPHLFGASQRPTGERGLYAYWRNTSDVLVAGAFKVLKTT